MELKLALNLWLLGFLMLAGGPKLLVWPAIISIAAGFVVCGVIILRCVFYTPPPPRDWED